MISKGNNIAAITYANNKVASVYYGGSLVWSSASSGGDEPGGGDYPANSIYLTTTYGNDVKVFLSGKNTYLDVPTSQWYEMPTGLTTLFDLFGADDTQNNLSSIIANFDTSAVTNICSMCEGRTNLVSADFSGIDVSNVTNMRLVFRGCTKLTSLDVSTWDTSNVTDMYSMFDNCQSLQELDLSSFNTYNVTNMSTMFYYAGSLTTLHLGNNWYMQNVGSTNNWGMFYNCTSLANVTGNIIDIKYSMDLLHSPLTNESAMVFINGLAKVTGTKTLTFKGETYDTLTAEEIALATSKGWTVARG